MDPFSNGLHCVYDHVQHSFIPVDRSDPYGGPVTERPLQREKNGDHPDRSLHMSAPYLATSASTVNPPRSETPSGASQYSAVSDASDASCGSLERVRRPRNAFMIFRSEFNSTSDKINRTVEHDHRHISRIVGHYWNQMSEEEKHVWRIKADQEKLEHMRKYPNYKFTPTVRVKKPVKRNVKRNGDDEMERCRRVADLLLEGKQGEELASAVKASDPRDLKATNPEETPNTRRQQESSEHYSSSGHNSVFNNPARPSNKEASLFPSSISFDAHHPNTSAVNYNLYAYQQAEGTMDIYARSMAPTTSMRPNIATSDYTPYAESPVYSHSPTYLHSPYSPPYPQTPTYGQQQFTYPESHTESYLRTSFNNLSFSDTSINASAQYAYHQDMPSGKPRPSVPTFIYPFQSQPSYLARPTSSSTPTSPSDTSQAHFTDHQRRY